MTWKLFLDDVRGPPDHTWVVARSVEAAWHYMCTYGLPHTMSLDHDLGDDKMVDAPVLLHSIIEAYLDGDSRFSEAKSIAMSVHSANPRGAENLRGLWSSFLKSASFGTL